MRQIGHIALLAILCQAALAGAFVLRAGIDIAIDRLGDGKLAAAMLAASLCVALLDRSKLLPRPGDERASVANWIWISLQAVCLWLALAFLAGAINAIPRSVPFLLAWILVSLGCLTDVARSRRWTMSGNGH